MKAQPKNATSYVRFFSGLNSGDKALVGSKSANLGEMYQALRGQNIRIPNGFALTVDAYSDFVAYNKLTDPIRRQLQTLNPGDLTNLKKRGHNIRQLFKNAKYPENLEKEITDAYKKLSRAAQQGGSAHVAVRSSIYTEDAPDSAFAGQVDTYLNVSRPDGVLKAVKAVLASLYTDRAMVYRAERGFRHEKQRMAVCIQLMVRSDRGSAGTLFTYDYETGSPNVIIIDSAFGLGVSVVEGRVDPDEFTVFKPTLKSRHPAIISKRMGKKGHKLVFGTKLDTKSVNPKKDELHTFSLTDQEILQLASWGLTIEEYFNSPMHLEWAKDGQNGKLYIVQAGLEQPQPADKNILTTYKLKQKPGKVIATGTAVGRKIGQGKARVIFDIKDLEKFQKGEILVTDMTEPDWEPILKKARGIVTDSGGRTAHAAIVSRELGIPAIVGTQFGTQAIRTGQPITLDCSQGEQGLVYDKLVPFQIQQENLQRLPQTQTQIMINIGEPSQAYHLALLPSDGVGLARIEFILNEQIKTHPLALINLKKLKNKNTQNKINNLMQAKGYREPKQFFIEQLAEGIARIAAAFYPKEVIVRLSDFKSNEYQHLIGGDEFEPLEQNPMLGWRGAARYYDPKYKEAFALECAAFRRVRDDLGLTNVNILVPFVRTVKEAEKVLAVLKANGLARGKNKLKIYMMTEIPSNAILADKFAQLFDGFSIGTNDLTQLMLGVDRGSDLVAHIYDERDEAVTTILKTLIATAHKHKRKIGICGQAPSDFPEYAEFLAREGIDSISVNPDALIRTILRVAKIKK